MSLNFLLIKEKINSIKNNLLLDNCVKHTWTWMRRWKLRNEEIFYTKSIILTNFFLIVSVLFLFVSRSTRISICQAGQEFAFSNVLKVEITIVVLTVNILWLGLKVGLTSWKIDREIKRELERKVWFVKNAKLIKIH